MAQSALIAHATTTTLPPVYIEQTITLKRGDTLANRLEELGYERSEVYKSLHKLNKTYRLRKLKNGQNIKIRYKEARLGQTPKIFNSLSFHTPEDKTITLAAADNHYSAQKTDRPLVRKKTVALGTIKDSLYMSARKADLPAILVPKFAGVFAWDIDFTRDIRPGDTFKVVYENIYDENGNFIRPGEILAAELLTRGRKHQAFRAKVRNGYYAYFDAQGRSKQRMLLRTPLEFARISSHYNLHRKHPVLGYTRAHKGTDFAAPTGTPIKAAGDGVVEKAKWWGGYGRYIRIRHNNKYKTAYAHLHRFARGMRPGKRIKQGDVIGYVGTSGRSTGPHLHYEVLVHGKQVNAMRVKLPNGKPLPRKYMKKFNQQVAALQDMWHNNVQVALSQK